MTRLLIVIELGLLVGVCLILYGCGGGTVGVSAISGTVSDINRNVVVGAEVWADYDHRTKSLVTGAYRIEGVPSGWRTIRARAVINGKTWVGSTAAEILQNEPTMNVNIVLAPSRDTTELRGVVRDITGRRVSGARVLLTTRVLDPPANTSAYDGPYSSIVAVTGSNGEYLLEAVPVGIRATVAASKVGYRNRETTTETISGGMVLDFTLYPSNLAYGPNKPRLQAIESYTMPATAIRADETAAYTAIKLFTSPRFRQAMAGKRLVRATPSGSLIETDLYWNALRTNDSRDIAGYGIYRATSPYAGMKAIDFVRDPYANFYGDTDIEITPYQTYYYAITSVDVEFLDEYNRPNPAAESDLSNSLSARPLGQLKVNSPFNGQTLSEPFSFRWFALPDAEWYTVYLYDSFPSLPLDPSFDYGSDPVVSEGIFPIWPRRSNPDESTTGAESTSIRYSGPRLISGHTYYWVVLAGKVYETDSNGDPVKSAYSYSEIRSFKVQ